MKAVLVSAVLLAVAGAASADVTVETYGTDVRPGFVEGTYPMSAIPANPSLFSTVTSTPDAFGDPITFNKPVSVRQVGLGWATWSGTYHGTVFYIGAGAGALTLAFPAGTKAVQLYAENETYAILPLTAVATSATGSITSTQSGDGTSSATGWGFTTTDGSDIQTVTVRDPMGFIGFAVGDIATSQGAICAADLNGDGLIDFSDYLQFLNFYDAQDPAADFNGDGLIDFTDYLEFLNHYDAGC